MTSIRSGPPKHVLAGVLALAVLVPGGLSPQVGAEADGPPASTFQARVWLDRGTDPVLQSGDRARVYYRTSRNAHIALLHIDTEGVLRFVLPSDPTVAAEVATAGIDYQLDGLGTDGWTVDESPGIGYFFILASPVPLRAAPVESGDPGTTTLMQDPGAGALLRGDPHVAVEAIVHALVPEEARDEFALDFTAYHVGQSYSFPRFMCYDCHTTERDDGWNPYLQTCPSVRVVIHSHPYYYPSTRYRGMRAMYPRPSDPVQPQFSVKERVSGEPGTPLVQLRDWQDASTSPETVPSARSGFGTRAFDGLPDPQFDAGVPVQNELPWARPIEGSVGGERPVLQRRTVQDGDVPPPSPAH